MGSIIGACVGSMFAGLCCGACRQCSGQKNGVISRLPYIFLFFLAGIFAIVMSLYGEKKLDLKFYETQLCDSSNEESTCTGNGSVYRVSFMLFIFELIHCLIIGGGAVSFHWLWFAIKFFVFVAGLTMTFLIGADDGKSNDFFTGYGIYFARYVSAIYLLLQILILISWGYKVNEWLQEKGAEAAQPDSPDQDEDEKSNGCNCYNLILVIATLGLYAASFTLCGFFFKWYGDVDRPGCAAHRTLISMTIVICIANGVVSGIRGDGSFFVSAVVSFYCTFLCFAALQSDDSDTCNIWANDRSSASLWIGYMITFIAIFYAAFRADQIGILWETDDDQEEESMEEPLLKTKSDEKDIETGKSKESVDDDIVNDSNYNDVDDDKKGKVQSTDVDDDKLPSKRVQKISNVYFHFVMMLAACYFAMLFTNWGAGTEFKSYGKTTMGVNVASQYATAILFWWTLLAPLICPSRFQQNDDDDDA